MKNTLKHALLLAVFILLSTAVSENICNAITVDRQVITGNDDAEQRGTNNRTGDWTLELGDSAECSYAGVRFQSVIVPKGAIITSAYLSFVPSENNTDSIPLDIFGEDADNASDFNWGRISDRSKTTAMINNWSPAAWTSGTWVQTPDITAIVQEIVDRANWNFGNAMAFMLKDESGNTSDGPVWSYNGNTTYAAKLHIEYTAPANSVFIPVSGGSDDAEEDTDGDMHVYEASLEMCNNSKIVGYRFNNITIPAGKTILTSYIIFFGNNGTNQDPDLRIYGNDIGNALTFSALDRDMSDRDKTDAMVEWNSINDWDTTSTYNSPSLNDIVQEIVGRPDWFSGNSMAFLFENGGNDSRYRTARAYDDAPAKAAWLFIQYDPIDHPTIAAAPASFAVSHYVGVTTANKSFTITNTGIGTLNYTITETSDPSNIVSLMSPATGTLATGDSGAISFALNTSALAAGVYEATFAITDPTATNSPVSILVSVTVQGLPSSSVCGEVPIYTENIVSPAIMILLDRSGSMDWTIDVKEKKKSPDISGIIQEIVDRTGWASGNAMSFIISGSGRRSAETYDGSSGEAPLLYVNYTYEDAEGDTVTSEFMLRVSQSASDAEQASGGAMTLTDSSLDLGANLCGVRFQSVLLPQGAVINSAYLEFTVRSTQTIATSLSIAGHDADTSAVFTSTGSNISSRTLTSATTAWSNIETWNAPTAEKRIDIAHDALCELVEDDSISWGFSRWSAAYNPSLAAEEDYTQIRVGCAASSVTHVNNLKTEINATTPSGGTPLYLALRAGKEYFHGSPAPDGRPATIGGFYTPLSCQPMFAIIITDGLGNTGTTLANVEANTTALCDAGITPVAIGFGISIDEAEQIYKIAEIANARGNASDDDDLYAVHDVIGTTAQPFMAYSRAGLVDALNKVISNVKAQIFHGSAPAPTTSVDHGDVLVVASFDATDWSGDLKTYSNDTGDWNTFQWSATARIKAPQPNRRLYVYDAAESDKIAELTSAYAAANMPNHNFSCWASKPIGDVINATPMIVSDPAFFYKFDGYGAWKRKIDRKSNIYVASNDGALHAFYLEDAVDDENTAVARLAGEERWMFIPPASRTKLNTGTDYDRCQTNYCHHYLLDGSPIAADIYDRSIARWKTILVCGQGEAGDSYFALDVTSGKHPGHIQTNFNDNVLTEDYGLYNDKPAAYMWNFSDADMGSALSTPTIDRVYESAATTRWAVFLGSGYSETDQTNKQAYLFGLDANDGSALWLDRAAGASTNKVKISPITLAYSGGLPVFQPGETLTGYLGASAVGSGKIVRMYAGGVELVNVTGTISTGNSLRGSMGGGATTPGTATGNLQGVLLNDALSPAMPATLDSTDDYLSDRIYTGNLYGTMHRVSNIGWHETPVVSKLFGFDPALTSPDVHPIRGKAAYASAEEANTIWVYFGTGRYEKYLDRMDMNQQYFFGLKESASTPQSYTSPTYTYNASTGLLKNYLNEAQATLTSGYETVDTDGDGTNDSTFRTITGTNPSNRSWVLKLDNTSIGMMGSERVIAEPLVAGGVVIFLTFIPDQDVCAGNGETWLWALDYKTGLPPSSPIFDINGDNVINDDDKIEDASGDHVVAGLKIGSGQGSHPVLYKTTLFITTTGGGDGECVGADCPCVGEACSEDIKLPGREVQLNSWIEE